MGAIYGSSYYTIANGTSWPAARASAINLGGDLVAINSAEENIWVFKNFGYDSTGYAITGYWIGFTDQETEGKWKWSNNSEIWQPHSWGCSRCEPNGNGDHAWVKSGFRRSEKTYEDFVNAHNTHWTKYGEPLWEARGPDWDDTWVNGEGTNYGVAEIPLSYFSIADASFREGKGGKVTITRTGGTTTTQTIRIKSSDGSATTADNDYSSINTTVSFAAGETSKTINVSTTADLDVEDDESFNLTITAEGTDTVPPQISDGTGKVTIKADDFKRGNSLYTIVDGPSWTQAENEAKRLGGNLASINDAGENSWIHSRFNIKKNTLTQSIQDSDLDLYWIGLSDQASEGQWRWSNGDPVNYTNWHRDQPSGGRNENYVALGWISPQWCDVEHSYSDSRVVGGIAEIPLTPTPTYSLSTSTTSIDEGKTSSVRTTISTTNVDQGTRLYYTLSGSGINSSDFSFGEIKSSRLIQADGTASFLHTAAADKTTEGPESFTINLYTDWKRTQDSLVATSQSISISDTSKTTTKPSYSLALTPSSIEEGESFRASIATTNVKAGTKLFYAIKGTVDADDFSGNSALTGNVTINADGSASFTRKALADKLTEGPETARVLLYSDQERTLRLAGPEDVEILDTSKTKAKSAYSISFSASNPKEGDILTSDISANNVDPGTRLYWTFTGSGINANDFSSGSLKGSAAIDQSGAFSLTHALAEDKTTEGSESLKLQLFSDPERQNLLTQESLTIRDVSKAAQSANLAGAVVQGDLITLAFDASLANTTPNTARFSVQAAKTSIPVRSAKVDANAGTLELTLASSIKPNQSVRLSYSDLGGDQSNGVLQTPDGTDLPSFSTSVTNANRDTKAPSISNAYIDGKALTLDFSEAITTTTPSNRRWTVKENGSAIPVVFSKVDSSNAQLDLKLSTAVDAGSTITLSYRDLNGDQNSNVIEDLAGNDLASITSLAVTNRTKRSTEPLNINTAEVDGNTITLAFDRELAATTPNTGTFRVTANGKAIKVTSIQLLSDQREALLNLKSPVAHGDSVALSYTDAKGNQNRNVIEDRDGNDLASISGLTLNNNTRKSADDLKVDYADVDGSTINIYFTDALSSSIPKESRFRVTANKRRQLLSSVDTDPKEGIVSLNLRKAISSEQDILINYRDLNGDQTDGVIQDRDGNDLSSFSNLAPLNDSANSDPPSLDDAYLDGKELVLEFDELLQDGPLRPSLFKVRAGKKRIRIDSASVPKDDAIAILNLKSPLQNPAATLSLSYKDLKGDQSSKIIQDLDGNDLESFRNVQVEII